MMTSGPEDEFDDETNGDPDSLNGEEDEEGFDEFGDDWPEEEEDDDDDDDSDED
jgi:hypothetical protein